MKKYTAAALLSAAALALSACVSDGNTHPENRSGNTSETVAENAPEESSGENTGNEPEISEGEGGNENREEKTVEEVIANFAEDSFIAPDGTRVMLTEATATKWDHLYFDFAYLRYAEPVYSDTVINPGLYDFEEYGFTVDETAEIEAAPFRVKRGRCLTMG